MNINYPDKYFGFSVQSIWLSCLGFISLPTIPLNKGYIAINIALSPEWTRGTPSCLAYLHMKIKRSFCYIFHFIYAEEFVKDSFTLITTITRERMNKMFYTKNTSVLKSHKLNGIVLPLFEKSLSLVLIILAALLCVKDIVSYRIWS